MGLMTPCILLLLLAVQAPAGTIQGQVVDISGGAVPDARVEVWVAQAMVRSVTTDAGGRFTVQVVTGAELHVLAAGFAMTSVSTTDWSPRAEPVRVVLMPASVVEHVTVMASPNAAGRFAVPAAVTTFAAPELASSPVATLDDVLRVTPGFSLFRRSSSRAANPTTQGATLRGLSASGASRALVLAEDLPLNDPFGGWVYWNKLPLAAIERVDVLRGPAGDMFGADAVGGVVRIALFDAAKRRARVQLDAGSHAFVRTSGFAATGGGRWSGLAAAEWSETRGFFIVPAADRGIVDDRAGSDHGSLLLGLDFAVDRKGPVSDGHGAPSRQQAGTNEGFARASNGQGPSAGVRGTIRARVYSEDRANGTRAQRNDTESRDLSGTLHGGAGAGMWRVRAGGGTQRYDQTFTAVAASRESEELTRLQRVPSSHASAQAEWVGTAAGVALLGGAELRRVEGVTNETRYVSGAAVGVSEAGGSERTFSTFVQALRAVSSSWTLSAGVRALAWTPDSLAAGSGATRVMFAPRAAIAYRAGRITTVRVSAYRAPRHPTLNELHREFRAGNVVTTGNAGLVPEMASGLDAGLALAGRAGSIRFVGFRTAVTDAVANVTLSASPQLIVRQRQNAGEIRASGLEVEADWRLRDRLSVGGSVALLRSRFHVAPDPLLVGNRVPQVPVWQAALQSRYLTRRGVALVAAVRGIGAQFDDDRNEFRLADAVLTDASVTVPLTNGLQAFAGIENAFDVDYDVGRTPGRTIGTPRTVRVGFRLQR